MEYRLICKGKLVEGSDETKAIEEIARLTGLDESTIRDKLLTGQRVKLKSSSDKAKIEKLYAALKNAGLDIELESGKAKSTRRSSPGAGKGPSSRKPASGARKKWLIAGSLTILLLLGTTGGYLWHLSRVPYPAVAKTAEAALADGNLVALAHANVSKLVELNRLAFGEMDPAALPVGEAQKDILSALFAGPANLREHLDQLMAAVYTGGPGQPGKTALLLQGDLDRASLLETYRRHYVLDSVDGATNWYVLKDKPRAVEAEQSCPDDSRQSPPDKPAYLYANSSAMLLIDDLDYGKDLMVRLQRKAGAQQDLTQWQRYRADKLASLMIFAIPETGKALGGPQGMMMNQAGSENTQIHSLAAGLRADLLSLSLKLNLSLFSDDAAWKSETSGQITRSIEELKGNTRKVTPTMTQLLSNIQIKSQPESLEVDVALDGDVLDDIENVARESLAALMGGAMTASQQNAPVTEQLQSDPVDYTGNKVFTTLPPLQLESYETTPLFRDGPFAVDLDSIKKNDDGLFEVLLQGKAGLPKKADSDGNNRTGELALRVETVTDEEGNNLLRDEHCVTPNELFGRSPNHEPETTTSLFQNNVTVRKTLRLRPDVQPGDIRSIQGYIRFTSPVSVREYPVPLQAGESIEQEGMRFYLSRVGDNSVSYQVSGNSGKLLEVRAFNDQGQPLRTGWRMSSAGDGRVTQNYHGKVHELKIFVASRTVTHKTDFRLENLFTPSGDQEDEIKPDYMAPEQIALSDWNAYKELDFLRLEIDPDKWVTAGKKSPPIAEEHWREISLYLTHTPSQWSNALWAHIYFPMLDKLPAVLSAFSYRIEEPAEKAGPREHYVRISYPYKTDTGEVVARHSLNGMPIARQSLQLRSGLEDEQRLDAIKGRLRVRLPIRTTSTTFELSELWDGQSVDGVTATLTALNRGTFAGHSLKIAGDIEKLVNVHGLDSNGQRVMADPINYQQAGYWTMTLPFGKGIEAVELILADKQEILTYPFELDVRYP